MTFFDTDLVVNDNHIDSNPNNFQNVRQILRLFQHIADHKKNDKMLV